MVRRDLARAMVELLMKNTWMERLLESLVEGVVTLDANLHITYFNHGAQRITGWDREQVLHRALRIVDPGVGTARRAVAIEVGDGASVLVGPDNGLFAPAVAMVGGATAAYELTNTEYHLAAPGPTFAGRDVFAPVAAHLCAGVPLDELGVPIDAHALTPGVFPLSRYENSALVCEALWVDRYGNVQLNIASDDLAAFGPRVRVVVNGRPRVATRAASYASIRVGELGLVVDSYGLLSLSVDRGSAAVELGAHAGAQVVVEAFDPGDEPREGVPIRLQPRTGGAR